MLLGLPGDNSYANYREANRALWRLTLLPLCTKILGALAEGLRPAIPGARLSVDLDKLPALSEDRERYWDQISGADFLSNTEKRRLPKAHQSSAPHQQLEAQRKDRVDHDLGDQIKTVAARNQRVERECQENGDDEDQGSTLPRSHVITRP